MQENSLVVGSLKRMTICHVPSDELQNCCMKHHIFTKSLIRSASHPLPCSPLDMLPLAVHSSLGGRNAPRSETTDMCAELALHRTGTSGRPFLSVTCRPLNLPSAVHRNTDKKSWCVMQLAARVGIDAFQPKPVASKCLVAFVKEQLLESDESVAKDSGSSAMDTGDSNSAR